MDTGASPSVYTVMSTSAVLAVSLEAQGGPAGFAWPPQHTGAEGWPLYIEDESRGSKEEPEYLEVFLQPGTRALQFKCGLYPAWRQRFICSPVVPLDGAPKCPGRSYRTPGEPPARLWDNLQS